MPGRRPHRNVVIEFPDYARVACYRSPSTSEHEDPAGQRDTDLIIVEGYDGPQP